jgi:hypothetical protein
VSAVGAKPSFSIRSLSFLALGSEEVGGSASEPNPCLLGTKVKLLVRNFLSNPGRTADSTPCPQRLSHDIGGIIPGAVGSKSSIELIGLVEPLRVDFRKARSEIGDGVRDVARQAQPQFSEAPAATVI